MEIGYILELGHGNYRQPSTWIEGEPQRTYWFGIKITGKRQIEVLTFRCLKCGYLESYAR
jgi:hypothetical protein